MFLKFWYLALFPLTNNDICGYDAVTKKNWVATQQDDKLDITNLLYSSSAVLSGCMVIIILTHPHCQRSTIIIILCM